MYSCENFRKYSVCFFMISNVHIIDYISKSPSQTLNALKVVIDGVKLLLQIKGIL